MRLTRDTGGAPNMRSACQCPGIIAAGHIDVKSSCADCTATALCPYSSIVDEKGVPLLTEQAPAAAFTGELQREAGCQAWRIVSHAADWLCAMPIDRAKEVLSIFERAIERSSSTGSRP